MDRNWQCPSCGAYNTPRRQACWQCGQDQPVGQPAGRPAGQPPGSVSQSPARDQAPQPARQIAPRPNASRAQRPAAGPARPGLIDSLLDSLIRQDENEPPARLGDRLIGFVVGLAFGVAAIYVLTAPLRLPEVTFTFWRLAGGVFLFGLGQWLLITMSRPDRRILIGELGLLVLGGLIYAVVG